MWSVMSDVCVLVFLTMRSWAAGSSPSDLLTFSVDTPTLLTPPTALHRSTHTHTQKLLIWLVKIKRLRLFVLHKLNFLNIIHERSYCGSEVLLIFLHHDYKKTKSSTWSCRPQCSEGSHLALWQQRRLSAAHIGSVSLTPAGTLNNDRKHRHQ